jgi:hypothetical protein
MVLCEWCGNPAGHACYTSCARGVGATGVCYHRPTHFSPGTLAITREMGLLYDSSLMSDVDCYELMMDGENTGVVELPVEWIRDDAVYFDMNRFAGPRPYRPPSDVLDIFRRAGVLRDDGMNSGCTEIMSPWGDAVAEPA